MTGTPEISVVIATRDRAERLAGILRTLAAQTLPAERFEVIVIDDGSTDGTADLLARAAEAGEPPVSVLRRSGGGPAVARNAGWRSAAAPLVAFTDDDCEAPADWLERTLAAAAAHPGSIIQGPTSPIPRELERTGPFTRTKEIPAPNPSFQTCNIAYPRELLERLGGFDEDYPEALGEDTDLGWRAREIGGEWHWDESVRMHHAVDDVGPVGYLRGALRGADAVRVFRRHPQLRAEGLRFGVIRSPRLPHLALAVAGAALARRQPALGALLALPYARALAAVCRRQRAPLVLAPYYAVWDLLFTYTALRGSLRHRTLVL